MVAITALSLLTHWLASLALGADAGESPTFLIPLEAGNQSMTPTSDASSPFQPIGDFDFPKYCSKPGSKFLALRQPPKLVEVPNSKYRLIQVLSLIRHGARTPAETYKCWPGYQPTWNCGIRNVDYALLSNETTRGDPLHIPSDITPDPSFTPSLSPQLNATQTLAFTRIYDVDPSINVFGGTCGKGHLISEGYQQLELMGTAFAKAYQLTADQHVLPSPTPLLSKDTFRKQIYFRSSDMQRTIASGSAFLTSFLRLSGIDASLDPIPVHTVDEEKDHIFPNMNICPALGNIREMMFASSSYVEFNAKYADLRKQLGNVIGTDYVETLWPGDFYDCLMSALCGEQISSIPSGLRPGVLLDDSEDAQAAEEPKSLMDLSFEAADDYSRFEYSWENSIFSKTAIAKFLVEFKIEMMRMILADLAENRSDVDATQILQAIVSTKQAQELYQQILANKARLNEVHGRFDARKLVIFAGHDTTILPFLTSLGPNVYDGVWPPYASQVIVEIYALDDKYAFRLIYNGLAITNRVPGCGQPTSGELCDLAAFFTATEWATPSKATEMCASRSN